MSFTLPLPYPYPFTLTVHRTITLPLPYLWVCSTLPLEVLHHTFGGSLACHLGDSAGGSPWCRAGDD